MNGNKRASAPESPWVDPDDAPDLSEADPAEATWRIGDCTVSAEQGAAALRAQARRGRPRGSTKADTKQAVTIRYSPEVLDAFRATGAGWQTRIDAALKDWLKNHSPTSAAP